jgi:uncharacterized protein YjbJ (UPF0337 family)
MSNEMTSQDFAAKWEQIKGQIKEKWGKLTNDDVLAVEGKQDQLLGKLRERYGYSPQQAKTELSTFMERCGCGSTPSKGSTGSTKMRQQPGA